MGLSTPEITAKSQTSYMTLRLYVSKKLIPPPVKVSAGRARGVRLIWPVEALEKIQTIKILRQSGLSNVEIAAVLKGQK
jgi:DNA-binding transcriptional MerR regulator